MESIAIKLAFIGAAGIAAQWLAWRLRLPAIVVLLAAGFVAGPVTGFIQPALDFRKVYEPAVGLAVAIILFEGGMTLNLRDIRETSKGVRRIVLLAGPLTWLGATLAARFIGGLEWPVAIILGAVLIVTGPTVIMPLLRSSRLKARPASLLRWEAIVNDPIGALFAVISFEVFLVVHGSHEAEGLLLAVVIAFAFSLVAGLGVAQFLLWAFVRGHVPEYLKAPVLFAAVLTVFAISNLFLEESGLLAVTIMGIRIANSRIASLGELHRFKETITVLLVSGLFILLTAALDATVIATLDWRALGFVVALLFVIRPAAVALATIGANLSWQERLLTAWIAPRGVVAVAVASLFGARLVASGVEDGERMVAFTFAVVTATVILHGFTLGPLARILDLRMTAKPGLLIVGGSRWATALGSRLKDMEVPVTIVDSNWNHLIDARQAGLDTHYGDALSEHAHHNIGIGRFDALIAATDNDAYNALVCTDFGPEIGRNNVYEIGVREPSERRALRFTIGGRQLFHPGLDFREIRDLYASGWTFQTTRLTDEFTVDDYRARRSEDARTVLWRKPDGALVFDTRKGDTAPQENDVILSFAPPRPTEAGNRKQQDGGETKKPAAPKGELP